MKLWNIQYGLGEDLKTWNVFSRNGEHVGSVTAAQEEDARRVAQMEFRATRGRPEYGWLEPKAEERR